MRAEGGGEREKKRNRRKEKKGIHLLRPGNELTPESEGVVKRSQKNEPPPVPPGVWGQNVKRKGTVSGQPPLKKSRVSNVAKVGRRGGWGIGAKGYWGSRVKSHQRHGDCGQEGRGKKFFLL